MQRGSEKGEGGVDTREACIAIKIIAIITFQYLYDDHDYLNPAVRCRRGRGHVAVVCGRAERGAG